MTHALSTHSGRHLFALLTLSLFFVGGGIGHFMFSEFYVSIVPDYIPTPALMVAISGLIEIVGGFAILMPRLRKLAGIALLLLIVAVFPANVFMAQHPERFATFAPWMLYARLPLQGVLLLWTIYAMRRARSGYGEFR